MSNLAEAIELLVEGFLVHELEDMREEIERLEGLKQ